MNLFRAAAFTLTFALAPLTMAQSPAFFMDEAVPLGPTGSQISFNLQSVPGTLCAVSLDLDGTPSTFFAEEICLGMSPALTTVLVASIPLSGTVLGSLTVPALPAIADIPLFGQGVVFHPAAPNGQFVTSNGESSVVHTGTVAIVDRFDNAAMAGFTGGFRTDVLGRLRGGDVTRRVHSTVAPQSVLFNLGIASPFGYEGVREQMVYRPVDLGASSAPELITAIRWKPFGLPQAETFEDLEILVGHTDVTPDYTIGSFSALPLFPQSGLANDFASNYVPGELPVTVFHGQYTVDPAALRTDLYMDYPLQAPFAYDGQRSLLIEFKTRPAVVSQQQQNGQTVRLMVQSSPLPAARVVAPGSAGQIIEPALTTSGQGDNAMADYQIEFTRVVTRAVSPFRQSPVANPNYMEPVIAAALPAGTSIVVEYRGAPTVSGGNATAWSTDVNVADGMAALQYRVTFTGNPLTNAVPSIDTLVVPIM